MKVFVAGATGVIGIRIVPLLVAAGHEVAGMTRTPGKAPQLEALGGRAVVCDVFERTALREAVAAFGPEIVLHELTDLPDDLAQIPEHAARHARIRREGTRNLLEAAEATGARRFLAQSVAWELSGEGRAAKAELERLTLEAGGVVLRYGQFYGPGTYYEDEPPAHPRIHVDAAARHTVELLDAPPGIVEVVEPAGL